MRLTRFHQNVRKTFGAFALPALKLSAVIAQSILREKTFAIHRKSEKTMKLFSRVAFVIYGM